MLRIAAVVLDMDGLMLDTEPLYRNAWQQACDELGFNLDDDTLSRFTGRPTRDCEAELQAHLGSDFPIARFGVRWPGLWRELVERQGIPHKRGLIGFLAFLEARRLPMAIATSSDRDNAAFSLRHAGLDGRFRVMVTGDQVPAGKPAPDIYLEAARRLGCDPTDCVALEDSDAGVLAACSAGMATICVPDLRPPSDAAARAAIHVLGSLDDARQLIAAALDDGSAGGHRAAARSRR
jgi:HAD superfamily hydrolase (TIGR01509 family)